MIKFPFLLMFCVFVLFYHLRIFSLSFYAVPSLYCVNSEVKFSLFHKEKLNHKIFYRYSRYYWMLEEKRLEDLYIHLEKKKTFM